MIVISNTTPLIGLASIQRFDLLRQLFGTIHIPPAVYAEAVIHGRTEGGAKREVAAADWIVTVTVRNRAAVNRLLDEFGWRRSGNHCVSARTWRGLGVDG